MKKIVDFIRLESFSGILLVFSAMAAIIIANTPFYGIYDYILHEVYFRIGFINEDAGMDIEVTKSILHWINDGFMAIFFFLVGLEIKREFVEGELSTPSQALLPALVAVGGMAVPAAIFWFINRDIPGNLSGWAIPTATDIAFALGVLALLGSRAPIQLKILLTAIAVLDDLGAIIVIALFYSGNIFFGSFYLVIVLLVALFMLNRWRVMRAAPYIILGMILWVAVLKSGVHATLAGVAVAMFIPVRSAKDPEHSPVENLIHKIHPWVAFLILPVFAFANAGVPFTGMGLHSLFDPLTFGIIAGLFIGKQLGIFGTLYGAIKSGLCPMPKDTSWKQLYGMSILCGIGFTMSLFIGGLAFSGIEQQAEIRLGVLAGSILSAVIGYGIIRCSSRGQ
ncbi:MAG TPA: Na+/H+ antiporter NhaA [Alphaproteobacteria bacterium]|mgnify:CR=1 FL=1|nr:Na+/H+ antiporter NhaA [Micavibrio sp.]MBK9561733.1 Na+/H+ antiporter NhaA [Micavibrio sp.]HQX27674.1 Na+/H+ antiporter NhaA [Alphaproteobacteria bacterium]